VIGLLFASHGGTKIIGFPASPYDPATNTLGLVTGWIELSSGLLVALGLFTRIGRSLPVVKWLSHTFGFPPVRGLFPITNGGEMAVAYCFAFFYIIFRGPGWCSLDSIRKQSPGSPPRKPKN
jgi:putative oxidoreductase